VGESDPTGDENSSASRASRSDPDHRYAEHQLAEVCRCPAKAGARFCQTFRTKSSSRIGCSQLRQRAICVGARTSSKLATACPKRARQRSVGSPAKLSPKGQHHCLRKSYSTPDDYRFDMRPHGTAATPSPSPLAYDGVNPAANVLLPQTIKRSEPVLLQAACEGHVMNGFEMILPF